MTHFLSSLICHLLPLCWFSTTFSLHAAAEKNKHPMDIAILGKKNYQCPVALALLKTIAHVVLHGSLHWALTKPPGAAQGYVAILACWTEAEPQVAWHSLAQKDLTVILISK